MPDDFADILAANEQYAAGFRLAGLTAPAARGLGVVTCIDSRIEPLVMLGLEPGDAKIVRNAGARVTDDALRSLALATNLLNVYRIMVIAHTDCAMAKTSDDDLHREFDERYGAGASTGLEFHAAPDQHAALAHDVARLRGSTLLGDGITVGGFIYDVETGKIGQVV